LRRPRQHQVDEFVGLGARDQDGRRHCQLEPAEAPAAEQVRHRLAVAAALWMVTRRRATTD
jgi:hypothetical protein